MTTADQHSTTPRTALVTGATGGIGREVALQLAELGWRVIAVGRDREGLAQLEEASALITPRAADLLTRSEEHTSELQSRENLVCRLLLEKKKKCYQKLIDI